MRRSGIVAGHRLPGRHAEARRASSDPLGSLAHRGARRNGELPSSSRSHLKQQASATQESGGHESVAFALRSRALAGVNGEAPTRHILDRRVQVAYGLTTSVRVHDPAEQPCAGARFKEMCSCTTSLDAHVRALDAGLPPARRTTGGRATPTSSRPKRAGATISCWAEDPSSRSRRRSHRSPSSTAARSINRSAACCRI